MVKSLKRLVVERAEAWFDRHLFKNAWRAFLVGIFLTCMVQSSSITTSLVVPMAGAGLLTIGQIFPYTLSANIGTTITAILAALVTGNLSAIIVAFSHLIFNISGIVIWWPLKVVPIILAQCFESGDSRLALELLNEFKWVNQACDDCLYALVREADKEGNPVR